MKKLYIYIHGKGGNALESEHYARLFPDDTVIGFDYKSSTPWDAVKEFPDYFDFISRGYDKIYLIANSIGAYFTLCALKTKSIERAFFISPVVDMEKLISDLMSMASITERELKEQKEILTDLGETLSWEYFSWVRSHPIEWNVSTEILYGQRDNLQSYETIRSFAEKHCANVTVMEGGEHWFHTDEQMGFLDTWISSCRS